MPARRTVRAIHARHPGPPSRPAIPARHPGPPSRPAIPELHEDLADRGLTVLAITHERPEVVRPFLERTSLTLPVGCDPEKMFKPSRHVGRRP
jgi:hypothetical protein